MIRLVVRRQPILLEPKLLEHPRCSPVPYPRPAKQLLGQGWSLSFIALATFVGYGHFVPLESSKIFQIFHFVERARREGSGGEVLRGHWQERSNCPAPPHGKERVIHSTQCTSSFLALHHGFLFLPPLLLQNLLRGRRIRRHKRRAARTSIFPRQQPLAILALLHLPCEKERSGNHPKRGQQQAEISL
jgi:hypothetical protein